MPALPDVPGANNPVQGPPELPRAKEPERGPAEFAAKKIIRVTNERVLSAALAGDGTFVITVTTAPDSQGVKETRVKLWDCKSGGLKNVLFEGGNHYYTVALSPSGKQLLVGDANEKDTALYDISDLTKGPRLVHKLANSAKACAVAFASDGKAVMVGTTSGSMRVYDAKSGEQRWSKDAHDKQVTSVGFSSDGKLVVSAGIDKTVQVRDANDGSVRSTLEGHTGQVTEARFSPDGTLVASGSYDRTARIWDASSGRLMRTINVPESSVRSVAFSPDGSVLAIGGLKDVGQTVLGLWAVQTGQQVRSLTGHEGGAYSVGFAADGATVFAGGWEGGVGLWQLEQPAGNK